MKAMDLLVGFGSVKDSYVISAEEFRQGKHKAEIKHLSTRKMWLIAAVIALTLLLVGCAVAYANGWFQQIFSARSETPLSSEQIQYIQNNEQIVGQSQTINDWTVDLKSTICDGRTGYLVFQITAPDDVDLEQYLNPPTVDDKRLSPGNYSASRDRMYPLSKASIGNLNEEKNYMFADGGNWISDNDGKANSVLYCMSIRCEKLYPDKPMLLEDPFEKENTFQNTSPVSGLSRDAVLEKAKAECTRADYNVYSISYDQESKMWKVEFGISWDSYYYEVIYINNNGLTQLVATRPYPEAGEELLPKPSEYS